MKKTHELIDLNMVLLHQTEKAILVSDTGESSRGKWLPKSQVEFAFEDPKRRDLIVVTLPEWLAQDKGLI